MADSVPAPGDATTPNRFDPFGPNAMADETRQAEFTNSNDTPTDVNMNAIIARSQALTHDVLGKNFEANSDLRQKYADGKFGKMA